MTIATGNLPIKKSRAWRTPATHSIQSCPAPVEGPVIGPSRRIHEDDEVFVSCLNKARCDRILDQCPQWIEESVHVNENDG
jgi:hypothetical protein